MARELGNPVIVVAGRILVTPEDLTEHGVAAAAQLLAVATSPEAAVAHAAKYRTWASQARRHA